MVGDHKPVLLADEWCALLRREKAFGDRYHLDTAYDDEGPALYFVICLRGQWCRSPCLITLMVIMFFVGFLGVVAGE
jgi:hypothetical protein